MKRTLVPVLICPLLVLLAGCEEEAPAVDTSASGGEAAGEIMGGTISDDMLPLDQLTSTSPPAARPSGAATPAGGAAGGAAASSATESGEAASAGAEAPAEAPAPEDAPTE
jgi:hypothetical protein